MKRAALLHTRKGPLWVDSNPSTSGTRCADIGHSAQGEVVADAAMQEPQVSWSRFSR
jgi:hypothetical protein